MSPNVFSRRGGKTAGTILTIVILMVLVAAAVLLWYFLAGRDQRYTPNPPHPDSFPDSQSASCPDVQLLSIPGTWESSDNDDPYNPSFNPNALLLKVTRSIQQQFPASRADVYTLPYIAQFSNPVAIPPDGQASYNISRDDGTKKAQEFLGGRYEQCPLTTYIIIGFSQGAVIAGDIANEIGTNNGPIPSESVLGVGLIADGRRDGNSGQTIGPKPGGVGAEVALRGAEVPGITMTGQREGGFGALNSKVFDICTPNDGVCDAPSEALRPSNWLSSLSRLSDYAGTALHSLYDQYVVDPATNTTATVWLTQWCANLVNTAPTPPHQ